MSVIARNIEARELLTLEQADARMDDKAKARVLALVAAGATITEVCSRVGFTTTVPLWRACDADEKFRNALREAQARGAASLLAEAHDNAREAAMSGDADEMRIADMYSRTATAFAEKMAPKEYGSLVKIAGDAELAAVQVTITKYDPQAEKPVN